MKRLLLCAVLVACAKDASEPSSAPDRPAASRAITRDRDVTVRRTRGPVRTTPRELFADFTRPDADGVALADKYRDGATFTATIKTVGAEEDGTPVVWIDVDGENLLTLDFVEPPPRDLHAGGQLTVTCKIGGASGALMMVTSCTRG